MICCAQQAANLWRLEQRNPIVRLIFQIERGGQVLSHRAGASFALPLVSLPETNGSDLLDGLPVVLPT